MPNLYPDFIVYISFEVKFQIIIFSNQEGLRGIWRMTYAA